MAGPLTVLLTGLHILVGAVWLGSMVYSLGVVQPRIGRLFPDPVRAEEVYRELAAGNRWRVVTLIVLLAGSGAGSAAVMAASGPRPAAWWIAVGLKAGLTVVAAACFWWVSWRGWPARVFALPAELPAAQRRFRRVALIMTALVGLAFGMGVLIAHPST